MKPNAGPNRSPIAFARRFVGDVRSRRLTGMSQQIAYNILFALGPLLMFVTAFCGFVTQQINAGSANPVEPVTDWLAAELPREAAQFLQEPVANALSTSPGFLLSFGGLFALVGARGAMGAIMEGLNEAYGVRETRSWMIRTGTAIALTVALAVALVVSTALMFLSTGVGQDIADRIGLGTAWSTISAWLRWPLTAVLVAWVIVLLHRYAPNFRAPLRWYLPGAALTVVLMVSAALGLRVYFAFAGSYSDAYGVFGAVLAFVFFLYIAGMVMLIGGVFNGTLRGGPPPSAGPEPAHLVRAAADMEGAA